MNRIQRYGLVETSFPLSEGAFSYLLNDYLPNEDLGDEWQRSDDGPDGEDDENEKEDWDIGTVDRLFTNRRRAHHNYPYWN